MRRFTFDGPHDTNKTGLAHLDTSSSTRWAISLTYAVTKSRNTPVERRRVDPRARNLAVRFNHLAGLDRLDSATAVSAVVAGSGAELDPRTAGVTHSHLLVIADCRDPADDTDNDGNRSAQRLPEPAGDGARKGGGEEGDE